MSDIVLIQETFANPTAATANATISLTGTGAGNALHLIALVNDFNTYVSAGDTVNTYNSMDDVDNLAAQRRLHHWRALNIAGGNITVTVRKNSPQNQWLLILREFGNAGASGNTNSAAYQPGVAANSTDGISTGFITPSAAPAMVSAFAWIDSAVPLIGGSGFTPGQSGTPAAGISGVFMTEHQRVLSTASMAATFSTGPSGNGNAVSCQATFSELVLSGSIGLYESLNGGFSGLTGGFRS